MTPDFVMRNLDRVLVFTLQSLLVNPDIFYFLTSMMTHRNTIILVDVKSQFLSNCDYQCMEDTANSYKKWGDLLRGDEGAQRAHHPTIGRATQITQSKKDLDWDLEAGFPFCNIKLIFVNI